MHSKFCNFTFISNKLYLFSNEYLGGPGTIIYPGVIIDQRPDPQALGALVIEALNNYVKGNRKFTPADWEAAAKIAVDFFGVKNHRELRRKGRDWVIRLDYPDQLHLFDNKSGKEIGQFNLETPYQVGRELLSRIPEIFGEHNVKSDTQTLNEHTSLDTQA